MIQTINLTKTFPNAKAPVLKDINLKIENGEFVSLVGRSGSGKSTLLYIISTLDRASTGEVLFDNTNVTNIPKEDIYKLRNKQIGFVFQFHYLIQELSALENVLLPARKASELEARRPLAISLLKEVGLEGLENRYPSELSGGEQQRVAIARALVMEPTYLFADEPTGNLDSINGLKIIELFEKFNREKGTTIIYVTHDKEFAAKARRQISLVDGALV
jgi:putative ABC transport system ATP-binding protein/lipoprotein-releasing system ATP-binding protein